MMIVCRECKGKFSVLTSAHLAKHGLTRIEYQKKHPGTPLCSDSYTQKKRAIYADPVKGEGIRAGLQKGRTPEVRAKAMETMIKSGKVADSAFMGRISRLGWVPELRDRHAQNIRLAQLRPERRKRQSQVATEMWATHKAEVAELRALKATQRLGARPLKRGRKRESEKDKTYFKIGIMVDKNIPVGLEEDRHSIVSARRLVSTDTRLQFDVVAKYHQKYRRMCAKTGTEMPT